MKVLPQKIVSEVKTSRGGSSHRPRAVGAGFSFWSPILAEPCRPGMRSALDLLPPGSWLDFISSLRLFHLTVSLQRDQNIS